jgi:putative ABC transport system substrate-binding protein
VAELGDFDTAFATMKRDRPDAVMIVTDPITRLREPAILEFLTVNRLPSLYEFSAPVKNGALISYGPSLADLAPRVAAFVDKILRGANPGNLPLEQPTRYYLVVNLKTAKALGLTIPQSILLRADEVIQ